MRRLAIVGGSDVRGWGRLGAAPDIASFGVADLAVYLFAPLLSWEGGLDGVVQSAFSSDQEQWGNISVPFLAASRFPMATYWSM